MPLLFYVRLLLPVATVRLLLEQQAFASQLCFSVLFASLSAAESEADGDGKKSDIYDAYWRFTFVPPKV